MASPMVGHVLPLAAASPAAGHDVPFATAADGVAAVRTAGVPAHDVAPGLDVGRERIEAVRLVRQRTGLGILPAAPAVDALRDGGAQAPS